MVEINITLFVQIAHFVLAYILLRVFLWRPIVNYLQDEERHKSALNDEFKKQQHIVEQKQFDLVKLKDEARAAFAAGLPQFAPVTAGMRKQPIEKIQLRVPTLSSEQIDKVVQMVAQRVEE